MKHKDSFIEVLDEGDKAALVSFTNNAIVKCNMTNDKVTLKSAVSGLSANGLASIYKGIEKALDVFDTAELDGYKMMIVFTDGYDEPSTTYDVQYKSLVDRAIKDNVIIYTIGISTIDEELLTKIADSTGGKYYYASVISELQDKVDEIKGEAIDYKKDSNNDGISDYHTKLIEEGKLVLSNGSDELKGMNLNCDELGNLTDDCDGDGLKNGEELKVVVKGEKTYLKMISHPYREYSDGDIMNDYEEVQNGTDPLQYEVKKNDVNTLCIDGNYLFETTANELKSDDFISGLAGYSAVINGVWNKQEIYRDLLIEYYSTYVTEDVIEKATLEQEKKMWYDSLITWIENINKYEKLPYDTIYNLNKLISYVNGVTDISEMQSDFVNRISSLIVELNKLSEDATELRFDISGLSYVKDYLDPDEVKEITGYFQESFDVCSNGISFATYGIDVIDTIKNLSKIEADKAVFSENIDALNALSIFGSEHKIRATAKEVMEIIGKEYVSVYMSAIASDILESAGDFGINGIAGKVSYVAIVLIVRDGLNILVGSKKDVEQMYRVLCYSDMCEAYSKCLFWIFNDADNIDYYLCYDQGYVIDIKRYLINIAQLRILGEHEYFYFKKNEGVLGFIGNYISGIDELKDDVEDSISQIKECTDSLELSLSKAIKYSVK